MSAQDIKTSAPHLAAHHPLPASRYHPALPAAPAAPLITQMIQLQAALAERAIISAAEDTQLTLPELC